MATCNYHDTLIGIWAVDDSAFYDDETDTFDDDGWWAYCKDIERYLLAPLNEQLSFMRLSLESGYYDSAQIVPIMVDELGHDLSYGDTPYDYDNALCRDTWDMCRSRAIRRYDAELRKIDRYMRKYGPSFGFEHLEILGRFSNGGAVYGRAA